MDVVRNGQPVSDGRAGEWGISLNGRKTTALSGGRLAARRAIIMDYM